MQEIILDTMTDLANEISKNLLKARGLVDEETITVNLLKALERTAELHSKIFDLPVTRHLTYLFLHAEKTSVAMNAGYVLRALAKQGTKEQWDLDVAKDVISLVFGARPHDFSAIATPIMGGLTKKDAPYALLMREAVLEAIEKGEPSSVRIKGYETLRAMVSYNKNWLEDAGRAAGPGEALSKEGFVRRVFAAIKQDVSSEELRQTAVSGLWTLVGNFPGEFTQDMAVGLADFLVYNEEPSSREQGAKALSSLLYQREDLALAVVRRALEIEKKALVLDATGSKGLLGSVMTLLGAALHVPGYDKRAVLGAIERGMTHNDNEVAAKAYETYGHLIEANPELISDESFSRVTAMALFSLRGKGVHDAALGSLRCMTQACPKDVPALLLWLRDSIEGKGSVERNASAHEVLETMLRAADHALDKTRIPAARRRALLGAQALVAKETLLLAERGLNDKTRANFVVARAGLERICTYPSAQADQLRPLLMEAARHPYGGTREAAYHLMGKLVVEHPSIGPKLFETIRTGLGDADAEVRTKAFATMGLLGEVCVRQRAQAFTVLKNAVMEPDAEKKYGVKPLVTAFSGLGDLFRIDHTLPDASFVCWLAKAQKEGVFLEQLYSAARGLEKAIVAVKPELAELVEPTRSMTVLIQRLHALN